MGCLKYAGAATALLVAIIAAAVPWFGNQFLLSFQPFDPAKLAELRRLSPGMPLIEITDAQKAAYHNDG